MNDAERAVLQKAPWEAAVTIEEGEIGVLGVVAELEDGRTAEDAVLLNARVPRDTPTCNSSSFR